MPSSRDTYNTRNINNKNHLNRHNEIARKCMHKQKYTLGNFKKKKEAHFTLYQTETFGTYYALYLSSPYEK